MLRFALMLALMLPGFARAQEEGPADSVEAAALSVSPLVHVIEWEDAITPVTLEFLRDEIEAAEEAGAAALVVRMDTPGGLLDATRDLVSSIFESEVPIIFWVGPSGARAASAGAFLTMAAHVACMAPGTNIGAASPVTIGGGGGEPDSGSTMANKMFNDTAAFARTIAERRGRNVEWAESAVRDAASVTETEAVELGVVDFVATGIEDAIAQSDGREVEVRNEVHTLALEGARLVHRALPLRYRLLSYLANPNVAYILMMFGIYGLFFELQNPGTMFAGVIGAICLILAFYSMQTLPMNFAGLLLIVLAGILFLLEAQVPSYGLLTIGGLASAVLGGLMLFDSPEPALRASLGVILPVTIVTGLLFAAAMGLTLRTMRTKPTTGREGMIGLLGVAHTALSPKGTVDVRGELWSARASEAIAAGDEVEVEAVDGLNLTVRKRTR